MIYEMDVVGLLTSARSLGSGGGSLGSWRRLWELRTHIKHHCAYARISILFPLIPSNNTCSLLLLFYLIVASAMLDASLILSVYLGTRFSPHVWKFHTP